MEDYLTPVSIIIYNRPEITEKLIQRLAIVKPQIIYVIADGHKDIYTDKELVLKTRKIVNQINWKCQLTKIYSDINMGLKNRIITGLSQVFSEVEKTIILEDDCIPSRSFFNFCSEILEKYESNNNIMVVSGTNEFSYDLKIDYESNYFFSRIAATWGWATWRRVWLDFEKIVLKENYNFQLDKFVEAFSMITKNPYIINKQYRNLKKTIELKINTWDYQFFYYVLLNDGKYVVPNHNLISNIGFGKNATHTKSKKTIFYNMESYELEDVIKHPNNFAINYDFERKYLSLRNPKYSIFKLIGFNILRLIGLRN